MPCSLPWLARRWAAQGSGEGEGAGAKCLALCRYLRSLGVAFDGVNSSDQGCLHKAAQRGHRAVCEW